MLIYDELQKDHRQILSTLDQLIASDNDGPETWGPLVQQLRDVLIPHARAEEAILYNSLRDMDATRGAVDHSYAEHAQAEAVLRSLQVTGSMNVTWLSAARALREALAHHIEEEETTVFAAAQLAFSPQEAADMGHAFVMMKPAVRDEGLLGTTLDMIANLLPERLRDSVRKLASGDQGRHNFARAG